MVNPFAVKYLLANTERIKPMVGADFHVISDLFDVLIVMENAELRPEEILPRLKAGHYSLSVGGHEASVPENASFAFYTKAHIYRAFMQLVRMVHHALRFLNITIPDSLKSKIKKIL
jgi:hypothetical protein